MFTDVTQTRNFIRSITERENIAAKAFKTALVRESKTDVALSVASRDNDAAPLGPRIHAGRTTDGVASPADHTHIRVQLVIGPLTDLL